MSSNIMGLVGYVDLMGVPLSASQWEIMERENRVKDGGWWGPGCKDEFYNIKAEDKTVLKQSSCS